MKRPVNTPKLIEKKSDERQVFNVINQLHDQATLTTRTRATGTTSGDGTYLSIWSDTILVGSAFYVRCAVIGRGTTGSAAFVLEGGFENLSGTLAVINGGPQMTLKQADLNAMNVQFLITGTTLSLQVRDDAIQAMTWTSLIEAVGA